MITINRNWEVERNERPSSNTIGTHLQDCVGVSYQELIDTFGEPSGTPDEYKIQAQWVIETPDGVATIYDWKMGDCYNGKGQGIPVYEVIDWHIGGHTEAVVQWIRRVLGRG